MSSARAALRPGHKASSPTKRSETTSIAASPVQGRRRTDANSFGPESTLLERLTTVCGKPATSSPNWNVPRPARSARCRLLDAPVAVDVACPQHPEPGGSARASGTGTRVQGPKAGLHALLAWTLAGASAHDRVGAPCRRHRAFQPAAVASLAAECRARGQDVPGGPPRRAAEMSRYAADDDEGREALPSALRNRVRKTYTGQRAGDRREGHPTVIPTSACGQPRDGQ